MPRIGKVTLKLRKRDREGANKEYALWYSSSERFHVRDLPSDFLTITNFRPKGYDTEVSFHSALRQAEIKYWELTKTERKVIVFKMSATAHLTMNKEAQGRYSGQKKNIGKFVWDMVHGVPECSLGVEYYVAMEIDEGEKKYYDIREDGSLGFGDTLGNGERAIEWTEQRELFFKSLYTGMEQLVQKMALFFDDDLEKTTFRIDEIGGNLKLLGPV